MYIVSSVWFCPVWLVTIYCFLHGTDSVFDDMVNCLLTVLTKKKRFVRISEIGYTLAMLTIFTRVYLVVVVCLATFYAQEQRWSRKLLALRPHVKLSVMSRTGSVIPSITRDFTTSILNAHWIIEMTVRHGAQHVDGVIPILVDLFVLRFGTLYWKRHCWINVPCR